MELQENFPTFISILKTLTGKRRRVRRVQARKQNPQGLQGKTDNKQKQRVTFDLEGEIRTGQSGMFAVNGEEFVLDDQTWVFGNIAQGAKAMVHGVFRNGGERYATKIVVK